MLMVMSLKKNSYGFSVVEALLIFVVLGLIGGVGFYVYRQTQDSPGALKSDTGVSEDGGAESSSSTAEEPAIPEGWVVYNDSTNKLSFYHPAEWLNSDIAVDTYAITDSIPSKYGTPDSVVYDSATETWSTYLNYGTQNQQKSSDDSIQTISVKSLDSPVAYKKMAHAAVAGYDIMFVKNDTLYRIRLPQPNSFNDANWEAGVQSQLDAMPDLVATIRFN